MKPKESISRFRQTLAEQGEGLCRFLFLLLDDPLDAEDLFQTIARGWARDRRARSLPFAPFAKAYGTAREMKRRGKKAAYRPVDLPGNEGGWSGRLAPLRRAWGPVPIEKRAAILLLVGERFEADRAAAILGSTPERIFRDAERGLLLFERGWLGESRIPPARGIRPGEILRRRWTRRGESSLSEGREAAPGARYDAHLSSAIVRFQKLHKGILPATAWKRVLRRVQRELPESEYVLLTHMVETPFGAFHLGMLGGVVVCARFGVREGEDWVPGAVAAVAPEWRPDAKSLRPAGRELEEYFAGRRRRFTFSHRLVGTSSFQTSVLDACARVPFGSLGSYKQIALQVGRPKAMRAVGGALGRNPLPVVIPCHRIISHTGAIGGYSAGLSIKERLLALEGIGGLFTPPAAGAASEVEST